MVSSQLYFHVFFTQFLIKNHAQTCNGNEFIDAHLSQFFIHSESFQPAAVPEAKLYHFNTKKYDVLPQRYPLLESGSTVKAPRCYN